MPTRIEIFASLTTLTRIRVNENYFFHSLLTHWLLVTIREEKGRGRTPQHLNLPLTHLRGSLMSYLGFGLKLKSLVKGQWSSLGDRLIQT